MDATTPHFEITEGPYRGKYEVPTEFTLGETADIEEIAGTAERRGARQILALLYVAVRRKHSDVRLEELRILKNDQWDAHGKKPGDASPPEVPPPAEPSASGDEETLEAGGNQLSSISTA